MTKNLLKPLRLAAAIALTPAVGFAENTVPFPNFPDPAQACRLQLLREHAQDNPAFETIVNNCIAENQQGYDAAKIVWPDLTQKNATFCLNAASKLQSYIMLGQCASGFFAIQPLPPQTFNKW
jgi:hypothetical protein